jgi:periplasmic protein TonB
MATIPARVGAPERKRLLLAAAIALMVEAALFGGTYLMTTHRHAAPVAPPPVVLSLVAAPVSAPAPTQPVVQHSVAAAPHAAHTTTAPRARAATPPPQAASQAAPVAQSATPTEPSAPAHPPAESPAPATPAATPMPPTPPTPATPSASFEGALRAAIQAALVYPESARMGGIAGRTRVAFDYRDGAVSNLRVVVSSGIGLLDRAALAAVRDAACPKPDAAFAGKTLSEQLWVTFNLNETE